MSAVLDPVQSPEIPSKPNLPAAAPGRPLWVKVLIWVVVLSALAAAAYFVFRPSSKTPSVAGPPTVRATVGPLATTLRMSGTTSARNFVNITAPLLRGPESRGSLVLLHLVKSGASVRKGEKIVEIDAQSAVDHIDDVKDTVRQAENDIQRRQAEQAVEWETLQQTLRVAKATYDKAHLDAGAAEVKTDVERQLLKLAEEEALARYREQQQDLANKKASHEAEIRILGLTLARHKMHLGRHEHDLTHYTIYASMDGLAVMQTIFRGGEFGQVQQGDQIWPGQGIMKVVDPKSMQVEGSVSQSDSSGIRVGQEVEIGLDAFPGVKFKGKVHSIGALAVGGWRQNYYIRSVPVRVSLEAQDPRVIPDLSAHCNIILGRTADTVQVPLSAVRESGAGRGEVWVKSERGFDRREVTLGARNNMNIAVSSGLKAGEEVRLN
jgi:multidrug efflux pump subunit AcrA (membrane-fusion protein)